MAVTLNNGTQTPVVGAETTIATIAGGPFDFLSVYFSGGTGGAGGAIGINVYATVAGIPTLVAATQVQGSATGTLVEFADLRTGATGTTSLSQNTGSTYLINAAGSNYTVKIIDLSVVPLPPGAAARQSCLVTLAGVNASDTAASTANETFFNPLASGATGTLTTFPGFQEQMDVGVTQVAGLNATITISASCGAGSVVANVKSQPLSSPNAITGGNGSVFRNVQLPVATTYTVSITNNATANVSTVLSAITYEGAGAGGGGGGGAVVLSPEVTGPSNNNVLSGPFSVASLAWMAGVVAPTWTQLVATAGAGQPLTIKSQDAFPTSGAAGGNLVFRTGLGDGAGASGSWLFQDGSPVVTRASIEPAHGRITAGGGGTDYTTVIGPDVGAENTNSCIWFLANGVAPTVNNFSVQSDGSILFINTPGGGSMFFALGLATYITLSSPGSFTWATGLTPVITQGVSAGAASAFTIRAQAAGGAANDGGALVLSGGAHAGASNADGSVQITTPLNAGFLTLAAATPLNLTQAQSDKNVFLFTGAPPGAWQVNFIREIADTSLVFIKNSSTQILTVSYLSGGTVVLAATTSALIASDGANLQKIITAA